jgi:hypothetical protein
MKARDLAGTKTCGSSAWRVRIAKNHDRFCAGEIRDLFVTQNGICAALNGRYRSRTSASS